MGLVHVWRHVGVGCLFVATLWSPGGAQSAPARTATMVLTGGKVFTADSTHPWAQAVAVRGARILAVGTDSAMRRLAGPHTREIALGGRVVIPGINDAHDHVVDVALPGTFATGTAGMPDPPLAQLVDSIRSVAARLRAGEWIRSTIGLRTLDDQGARRDALDRVSAGHPVFLYSAWGHGAILNSAALRALGIYEHVVDPLGGWYERDASGRPTGRLDEYAAWAAYRRVNSRAPEARIIAGLRAFADSSLRMGVTSVQDMAGDFAPGLTVRAFRDAKLPIRTRLIRWSIPDASGLNEAEWRHVTAHPGGMVVVSGRKWVLDGTPIERNALRRTPYHGSTSYGRLDFPLGTVRAILASALRPGAEPLHLHVVGDSTIVLVLAQMESLAPDSTWRKLRVRIEHASGLVGPLVARASRLGIVIAQPRRGTPLRTWHDAGIPLAYGSDALRNPFYNMMAAVTSAATPPEALTREEAVTMYTLGSAYAEWMEREKGSLAPGMLADLAVLSQDIFTVPERALPGTTSVLTMVGGRVAYDVLTRPCSPASSPAGCR
jgi:predicted amidohydrolase YtcJ